MLKKEILSIFPEQGNATDQRVSEPEMQGFEEESTGIQEA